VTEDTLLYTWGPRRDPEAKDHNARIVPSDPRRTVISHLQGDAHGRMLSRTESERTLRFEVEAFDESKGRVLIERAIVEGHVGGVKTERSEAELPLAQIIKESLLRCEEGRIRSSRPPRELHPEFGRSLCASDS
jgi:hypothetical protein